MGTWRSFDTDLWNQPWFEGLSHGAKLLYVYAFTSPRNSQAGFARMSLRHVAGVLSLAEGDVRAALGELKGRLVYYESMGLLWTKGFLDHQCQNDSFLIAAGRALARDIRDQSIIQEFLAYNTSSSGLMARYPYGWGRMIALCGHGGTTVVPPPVPVPVPVPSSKSKRSTKRSREVPGDVARLVDLFRAAPGVTATERDGPVIAGQVGRYGVAHVEAVIRDLDLSLGAATNPLQYLAGACKRPRPAASQPPPRPAILDEPELPDEVRAANLRRVGEMAQEIAARRMM